ncbi:copper resistance protein CopC [Planococcus sp. CP5-4]|uniref:copper resistance CopC family protein n=1 Tax=unclassified Planococcus (in: firmicutes) TaxID=2662419 RepID=UPI001C2146F1|nr:MULTISPECIES: copper resistance CopC family protein [unclassified Planococcus (in: firmicutes)]MBU9674062.1 copper resistance protein CopC [Planococcus sp. CP5-4_YE]MBV0909933.1 copper resistance protein CopC [Planococcus sp. CP5-4_UN]MBW6064813.1 copper resistance protein CopC [Planococcus sp. CP5-4]
MKKTLILLSTLLVLPMTAHAHSVLESSTPAEGSVVAEPIEQVVLDFSAGIEQGSAMTMTMDGTAVDFSEVAVMEDQLVGTPAQELEDGSYVVEYDVLSEDGHPIQGSLAFELQAGEQEAAQEEQTQEQQAEEVTDEQEAEEAEATEAEETQASDTEQASSGEPEAPSEDAGSSMTLIIAGIAIILLIAAVVLLRRKR